ncbi:MAG: PUA domain-containing protein [Haloferacaceae archaeon]
MSSDESDLTDLRTVADYQFGADAGEALFPPGTPLSISRSTSGRPRQIHTTAEHTTAERIVTYATDGRFTLGLAGGRRLVAATDAPRNRVVVGSESQPFVRDGKNVFAKFVRDVDEAVRPGDEVAVVHEDGDVLGVGRAELAADAMCDFETGMAVKVRTGAGD